MFQQTESSYQRSLEELIDAVTVLDDRILWRGKPTHVAGADLPDAAARRTKLENLSSLIYSRYYQCGGVSGATAPNKIERSRALGSQFVDRLKHANATTPHWVDTSWKVDQRAESRVDLVHSSGLRSYVDNHRTSAMLAGDHVYRSSSHLGLSPGFFAFFGAHASTSDERLIRFYWNLQPDAAASFVSACSTILNDASIPFQAKVAAHPQGYARNDSAVLYLRRSVAIASAPALTKLWHHVSSGLDVGIPALTKQIAPAVGLAEDPGDGSSFGMHRCKIIAEALLTANGTGQQPIEAIAAGFQRSNLSVDLPYLSSGSGTDRYEALQVNQTVAPLELVPKDPGGSHSSPRYDPIRVASAIADWLAATAIWHEDRCNWLSPVATEDAVLGAGAGFDLYSGTAGIGLFLAELGARTGDRHIIETAQAAASHAIAAVRTAPDAVTNGFFSGRLGVAFCATEVGRLLGRSELVQSGSAMAAEVARDRPTTDTDFLSGSAGEIHGLLLCATSQQGHASLVAAAQKRGQWIVDQAIRCGDGIYWRPPTEKNGFLTGFGHGSSGIVASLIALDRVAQTDRYRDVVDRALIFEDGWFDTDRQNWPDLRSLPRPLESRDQTNPLPHLNFWCHGAPGIAAARLAARLQHSSADSLLCAALATTARHLTSNLLPSDFSLCHGAGGLIAVLQSAARWLPEKETYHEIAASSLRAGAARFGQRPAEWPTGIQGVGSSGVPGLMLGVAGIGRLLLRQAQALPELLWPEPA